MRWSTAGPTNGPSALGQFLAHEAGRRRGELLDAAELSRGVSDVGVPEVEVVDADLLVEFAARIRATREHAEHDRVAVPHEVTAHEVAGGIDGVELR